MNNIIPIMSLLFKQLYSRQGKKDAIRIAAGLVILAVFEIGLIRQAGIDESVLRKTYIILALLLMNTYMVFLSVTSQWKESYMKLSCLLPISSRSFWLAQSVVLFVDTCLRRTLFFLFYRCSYLETERCQGRKHCFGSAGFRFYRLLHYFRSCAKQPLRQKEELDVSAACGDIRLCMYQRRFDAGRHDSALRGSYPVGGGH